MGVVRDTLVWRAHGRFAFGVCCQMAVGEHLMSESWPSVPLYRQKSLFIVGEAFSLDCRSPLAEKAAPIKNMAATQNRIH
jgi:hypothetical protein